MHWTDQETTTLINLWPTTSVAQIAARLQRSRNSICKKAQRLRLDGASKLFEVPPRKPLALPARIPKSRLQTMQTKPLPPLDDSFAMDPCSLIELDRTRCHWPLGDAGAVALQFCGGQSVPGQHYCAHHLRIASKG
jgi:GcrA cell cycle regulator